MLKEGMRFGRYRIERKLGSGGMGAVYVAYDTEKNRTVAIKVIHPHIAEIEQFIKRFHQEAILLEKLAHPRVVRIYESGQIGEHHYIAMEFVTGKSLTALMHERVETEPTSETITGEQVPPMPTFKPFPEKAVMRILEQMARVLQEAHELGVIHRDIKPDNIIVTDTERWDIKLLDFGIAKDTRELHTMVSQTGQVIGTPAYMSPEQCEGKILDIRSDLYSLGVTAYQMLAGRLPFPGPTTMAFMKQHLLENPPPLKQHNPEVSDGMAAIVAKMLKKDPEHRYQTPQDLLEEINRLRRGEPPRALLELATPRGQTSDVSATRSPEAFMTFADDVPGMPPTEPAGLTMQRPPHRPTPKQTPTSPTIAAPQKRTVSTTLLILVLLLLAVGGAFGGYWFLLRKGGTPPPSSPTSPPQKVKTKVTDQQPKPSPEELLMRIRMALAKRDLKAANAALKELKSTKNLSPAIVKKAETMVKVTKGVWELERYLKPNELKRNLFLEVLSVRKWTRIGGPEKVVEYINAVVEGEKFLASGQLEEAERAFKRALSIHKGALARNGIRRLKKAREEKIKSLLAKKERRYRELIKKGRSLLESDDFEGARDAFREARKLMPFRREVLKWLREVDRRIAEMEQEFRDKLNNARTALKKGNWQRAQTLAEEVALKAWGQIKNEAADIARDARRLGKYSLLMARAENAKREGKFLDAKKSYKQARLILETPEAKHGEDFCSLAQGAIEAYRNEQWEEAAKHASWALSVDYHPAVATVAVVSVVRAKRAEWFKVRKLASFSAPVAAAVADNGRIALAHKNGISIITSNGQLIKTISIEGVNAVALKDGLLVAGFRNGSLRCWRMGESGFESLWDSSCHTGIVTSVAFSPEGKSVYSAGADKHICRVNHRTGKILARIKASTAPIKTMLVMKDGCVVVGDEKGALRIYNTSLETQLLSFRTTHTNGVRHLASLRSSMVVSVGGDNTVRVWALDRKKSALLYRCTGKRLYSAVLFFGVIVVGEGKELKMLVMTEKRKVLALVRSFTLPSPAILLIPDPQRLRILIVCEDGTISEFALEVQR